MSLEEYFGDWLKVIDKDELMKLVPTLNTLYGSTRVVPEYKSIFKAFTLCTFHDCKIVFLGQDPYPQIGVATGVLFGNKSDAIELSPSLEVIKEAAVNYEVPHYGLRFDQTLESWARQGILMLNSALTCEANRVGSHTMLWRPFISKLLRNMSLYNSGIIYVLFGTQAQTFEPYINSMSNTIIKVKHPAWYARQKTKMPHELFVRLNTLVKGLYGDTIEWYTEY